MRFCSIASGSSGNSIYVGSDAAHLLVDVGISGKRIEAGLAELDVSPRDVDGILITHEHSDHIQGLGVIARKYQIPIYATEGTLQQILSYNSLGKMDEELFHPIMADKAFSIKDLKIKPMKISHDAAQPVGYRISCGRKKMAICTDLGVYNKYTVDCLRGLNALLVEANHDVNMLQVGPYPYPLKQRILGDKGHLSNENCGRLLCEILHDDLQTIVLGHLSQENNMPELAYETVRMEINMSKVHYKAGDFDLRVAKRNEVSQPVII